ncbi:AMP-binding protein, partial [Streptomyces sp. NPDC005921]
MSLNLATMLHESALADPDKPCVIIDDTTLTYAQVEHMVGLVAGNLLALGLERGAKVAVQLPNMPQFLFAYLGAMRAGLVMVPLNPLLRAPEVAYHLENSDAQVLITGESYAGEAHRGASAVPGVSTYVVDFGGGQRPEGTAAFEELLVPVEAPDIVPTDADDTAVLLYTSGTTGKPKGAELTHFQLFMNCTVAGELFGFRDDDVVIAVLPLFHVFGLSSVLNTAVRFGTTLVLVPRFEPDAVVGAIERHRATVFPGVPTMYVALLGAADAERDLSSLRVGVSGGASLPGEVTVWTTGFAVHPISGATA